MHANALLYKHIEIFTAAEGLRGRNVLYMDSAQLICYVRISS